MTKEELANKVYKKMENEFNMYKNKVMDCGVEYAINNAYDLAIKEEMLCLFFDSDRYNKYELQALLTKENTLEYLYDDWMDSEGGIHTVLEDYLEISISDLCVEHLDSLRNKFRNGPNVQLIDDITNALNDFNNYNYCDDLLKKFDIEEEFTDIDVYEIMKNKEGKEQLYDKFKELKDNKDLQYLSEISVINSENFNNIDTKILPKLKQLIEKDQKNLKRESKEDR